MIAIAGGEPGARRAHAEIESGAAVVSWINLGEVYYLIARRHGEDRAAETIERAVRDLRAEEPDRDLVLAAARLKARHQLSYADAFAVATAERHEAPVLTGDPEILALGGVVRVVDLRAV